MKSGEWRCRGLAALVMVLAVLAGCGAPAGQETFPPETGPAGSVSAPAIVTQGRAPAEDYDLPAVLAVSQTDMLRDQAYMAHSGEIELLAEAPEAEAAFYALPSEEAVHKTALIRWGDTLAEFDWDFAPHLGWPQLVCFDFDSDGEEELVLTCYADYDPVDASVYQLHVVERNGDGTLTDYALPESLWREDFAQLLVLSRSGDNRAWVNLGRELVEFSIYGVPKENLGGSSLYVPRITDFTFTLYGRAYWVELQGPVFLDPGNGDTPRCAAGYSAWVSCREGSFMLFNLHIYDYDQ